MNIFKVLWEIVALLAAIIAAIEYGKTDNKWHEYCLELKRQQREKEKEEFYNRVERIVDNRRDK